ncbi:hypothetical protein N431DRAFT_473585 [Stipitochalara longipes BDJ]|nr:hypothetical protein N431DRAFT_473585 [Stipitochalara longipes BDJ]
MKSTNSPHTDANSIPNTAKTSFEFITTQNPEGSRDRETSRRIRSHAVKHALQGKKNRERESNDNFRATSNGSPRRLEQKGTQTFQSLVPRCPPHPQAVHRLYPFDVLAAGSPRLKVFLSHDAAKEAAEPVFSVADDVNFQTFPLVFRTGRDDPALLNAIMLTFAFAATGGIMNEECIGYQSLAMGSVRKMISSPDMPVSAASLGAILLLAGVEARLGMPSQVQLHMTAISKLLNLCKTRNVYLSDGIKRAIFWQDLNTSIMTGSKRIVDHTTFAELHWGRDPYLVNFFVIPPGFQDRSHMFTEEFVEVLEDINALQCIRDSPDFILEDTIMMVNLDSQHASIESRLVDLPNSSLFLECCRLAAYLCSCMLCCKVYRHSLIPSQITSKLLHKLQQSNEDHIWDNHTPVLAWLIFIGGAYAPTSFIRSGYIELLRVNSATRFAGVCSSWDPVYQILKQFIWSEKAFSSQVKAFWEESSM